MRRTLTGDVVRLRVSQDIVCATHRPERFTSAMAMSSQLDNHVKSIRRFQHSHRMSMLHCLVRTPILSLARSRWKQLGAPACCCLGTGLRFLGPSTCMYGPAHCVWGVCVWCCPSNICRRRSCVYPYGVPTNGGSHRGAMRSCSKVVLCALDENREHPMAVSTLLMSQNRTHTCGHMS